MKPSDLPSLGTAFAAGFYSGIINVNGTKNAVITAPKSEGQIIVQLHESSVTGEFSPNDCRANTAALLNAGSHAAEQVTELDINGVKDWLIPSRDVLELNYRNFKPTARKNFCSFGDGENANSVPPGWLYTPDIPAKTEIELFRDSGAEAFDEAWYVSSTVLPDGNTTFVQHFFNGYRSYYYLRSKFRVRAVRLIQLDS